MDAAAVAARAAALGTDLPGLLAAALHALLGRTLHPAARRVEVAAGGRRCEYSGAPQLDWPLSRVVAGLTLTDPQPEAAAPFLVRCTMGEELLSKDTEPSRTLVVDCHTVGGTVAVMAVCGGADADAAALAGLTAGHVQRLLAGLVAAPPNTPVGAVPLLGEAEEATLRQWGRSTAQGPSDVCVHELVRQQVEATPQAVALSSAYEGVELTYAKLWAVARGGAAILCGAGVGRGAVAALCAEEGAALVLGELAVLLTGAAFAPLNPNDPPARIADLWQDLGCAVVILTASQLGLYSLAKDCGVRSFDAETLFGPAGACLATDAAVLDAVRVTPADLCHVIYTSGSTGRPKGVLMSHRGLLAYAWQKAALHKVTRGSRVLLASASTFDPSLGDIFSTLAVGATLCLDSRAALLQRLGDSLAATAATHVLTTPALWSLVHLSPAQLPALKVVALGGEQLPTAVAQKWGPALQLVNTYGVTEVCVYQTHYVVPPEDAVPKCIGAPYPTVDVAVVDAALQPVPVGVVGELCLGGVQVGRRYLNRPELSAERFVPMPEAVAVMFGEAPGHRPLWYRTGDLATFLPDGSLRLLGRADTQVKIRGQRVELEEIEAVLRACPLVGDVAAALLAGTLHAFVALAAPAAQEIALDCFPSALPAAAVTAIVLFASARLPAHMVPQRVLAVAAIPVTQNGKVDRRALPSPEAAARLLEAAQRAAYVAPEGGTERVVARLWGEELHCPVGALDHFFQLGGDSLSALRIARRMYCLKYHDHPKTEACPPIAPPFGDIQGPLSPWHIVRYPVLREYCAVLQAEGLDLPDVAEPASAPPPTPAPADGPSSETSGSLFGFDGEFVDEEESAPALDGDGDGTVHRTAEVQALFQALFDGHNSVVRTLLEGKVSPDGGISRGCLGTAPLHVAAATNNPAAVELLLAHGARLHVTNRLGIMPVHLAAQHSAEALGVFLRHGIEPGVRDRNRQTLLHFAARQGNSEAVRMLVEGYSDVVPPDAVDRWQRTPVHWAILNGHLACLRTLLELGADPTPVLVVKAAKKKTHLVPETPLQVAARVRADQPEFEAALQTFAELQRSRG